MLVTGATDGIGKATALELARRGARVIVHGRSLEKVRKAQDYIRHEFPGARLEAVAADLASLEQVRALARDVRERFGRLDVLIHNAGVYMQERVLSADGYEMTFAVNHLAPFLLTRELLPLLRAARARVITVASTVHANGRIDFENLGGVRRAAQRKAPAFDGRDAYVQSKLANVMFARELAVREKGQLTSNSLHPGVITTKLLLAGFSISGASPDHGAATSVYLATSPAVAQISGKYFEDQREAPVAPQAQDAAAQKRLWDLSEQLVGPQATTVQSGGG
jgi:NAD(P)-dependent dehydrogenase (short-subunit alcohol dehydrogenase family)